MIHFRIYSEMKTSHRPSAQHRCMQLQACGETRLSGYLDQPLGAVKRPERPQSSSFFH